MPRRSTGYLQRDEFSNQIEADQDAIADAIFDRILQALSVEHPEALLALRLRKAADAYCDYSIQAVKLGARSKSGVPVALLDASRVAADLDTSAASLVSAWSAAATIVTGALIDASNRVAPPHQSMLTEVLRAHAMASEHLIHATVQEFERCNVVADYGRGPQQVVRLKRLLAGEFVDVSDLPYRFENFHLGVILSGTRSRKDLAALSSGIDAQLLLASPEETMSWAWFGARNERCLRELSAERVQSAGGFAAVGEVGHGLPGWRLTHRQALAAFPIAIRSSKNPVYYRNNELFVAMLRDRVLAQSLFQRYLEPLLRQAAPGQILIETLSSYFESEHNTSTTAETMGVTTRTITKRLRAAEVLMEQAIDPIAAEFMAVMKMAKIEPFCAKSQ